MFIVNNELECAKKWLWSNFEVISWYLPGYTQEIQPIPVRFAVFML
jgi:hypothetical protein